MRHLLIFLIGLMHFYLASGQEVLVLDQASLSPIAFALVFDNDTLSSAYTDRDGKVRIDNFHKNGTLIFRHSSYQTTVLTLTELAKQEFKVLLKEKIININEIIISAGRWEQKISDVPSHITYITPGKMFNKNPQTVADALKQSGEVFIQKSQQGGGSPMIRGFSANSLLIVADGVRMNNAIYRSGNLHNINLLDANVLERIEVINGPGSVIYGSDALGGVMNFQMITPEPGPLHGAAFSRVSTANWEKTGHIHLIAGSEKWHWLGAVTYSDFSDLRSGGKRNPAHPEFGKRGYFVAKSGGTDSIFINKNPDIQRFSGYSQVNVTQKIRFVPGSGFDLNYGFHYTTSSDIPRYDRLIEESGIGQPIYAEWYYGPQKWMMHNLGLAIPQKKLFDRGKIIMSYQQIEESRHSRKYQKNFLKSQVEKVNVYSLNADFKKSIKAPGTLFYGSEFTYNRVNSSARALDIISGITEATYTRYPAGGSDYYTAAGYISWQSFISPQWILNSGLRYNHTWMYARSSQNEYAQLSFEHLAMNHGTMNGNMGMVYKPNQEWKLNSLISTGFRVPNIDDVGKIFDFTDAFIIVPNPNLKPEYIYNFEAGAERRIFDQFDIGAVAFFAVLHNAMVRRDYTYNGMETILYDGNFKKVQALVNTGKAFVYGSNIKVKAEIAKWIALSSSFNVVKGEDAIEKVPLRHASPAFGNCSAIISLGKIKTEVDFSFNGPKSIKEMPPEELSKLHLYTSDGSLSWSVVSIYSSYQFKSKLSVQFDVENLFDVHYRPYSSGISAPGLNFVFALKSLL